MRLHAEAGDTVYRIDWDACAPHVVWGKVVRCGKKQYKRVETKDGKRHNTRGFAPTIQLACEDAIFGLCQLGRKWHFPPPAASALISRGPQCKERYDCGGWL